LTAETEDAFRRRERVHNAPFLDLFAEDSWRNVCAGELDVRPPAAPTTLRESGDPVLPIRRRTNRRCSSVIDKVAIEQELSG
jgi:hypothetical protein